MGTLTRILAVLAALTLLAAFVIAIVVTPHGAPAAPAMRNLGLAVDVVAVILICATYARAMFAEHSQPAP